MGQHIVQCMHVRDHNGLPSPAVACLGCFRLRILLVALCANYRQHKCY